MRLSDFSYGLPPSLIAQHPTPERDHSRLLHVQREGWEHLSFADFPGLLQAGDLLVVNDTRVIKARLRGEKDSGGQAELLIERIEDERQALCQVRVSKPLKAGRSVTVGSPPEQFTLQVLERSGQFYRMKFPDPVLAVLERWGETPLPPYIRRPDSAEDDERYQTVYGRVPGAVAAPTAGLHFTEALLAELAAQHVDLARVTLHVGAGTFAPVRVDDLGAHRMHAEQYTVSAEAARAVNACRARGGRVIAVGTTVVRTLESAVDHRGCVQAGSGETSLFITPGFTFRAVDALLTNFHLPESTLLMLVCAFAGYERVMAAYAAAIAQEYRFFSYGDACFFHRIGAAGPNAGPGGTQP